MSSKCNTHILILINNTKQVMIFTSSRTFVYSVLLFLIILLQVLNIFLLVLLQQFQLCLHYIFHIQLQGYLDFHYLFLNSHHLSFLLSHQYSQLQVVYVFHLIFLILLKALLNFLVFFLLIILFLFLVRSLPRCI